MSNELDIESLAESNADVFDVPLRWDPISGEATHGVKVVGANSDEYQKADRAWSQEHLKKTSRRGRIIDTKSDTGAAEADALFIEQQIRFVVACVKSIYGFKRASGETAVAGEKTVREMLTAKPEWRKKILAEISMERDFTLPSSGV
jgi:hypothetical protein